MNRNIHPKALDAAPRTIPDEIITIGDPSSDGGNLKRATPDIECVNAVFGRADQGVSQNLLNCGEISPQLPDCQEQQDGNKLGLGFLGVFTSDTCSVAVFFPISCVNRFK
jgi:hypothetical protein